MRLPSPFPFPQGRASGSSRSIFGGRSAQGRGTGSALKMRLLIALAIALFAVISYYAKPGDVNEVTGETERVALTEEADEIELGFQAAGEIVDMHGGPSRNRADQERVERIGNELLVGLERDLQAKGRKNPYRDAFRFTLLADPQTVNAFALPGGPVFVTEALYRRLTDGQLAGVLGHEIGHVLSRHSNKQMARQGLFQGVAGAIGVLGGDMNSAQMGQMVSAVLSTRYGRDAELESDKWGVRLMALAGYDPRAMVEVMKILDEASGSGGGPPEFLSTHPKPANRVKYIEEVIDAEFPDGVPPNLRK